MFWAAMPAILSGWRSVNRKFLPDSSLAQCRKGVFQRGWPGGVHIVPRNPHKYWVSCFRFRKVPSKVPSFVKVTPCGTLPARWPGQSFDCFQSGAFFLRVRPRYLPRIRMARWLTSRTRTKPRAAGGTPSKTISVLFQLPGSRDSVAENSFDLASLLFGFPVASTGPQSIVAFRPSTVALVRLPNCKVTLLPLA